MKTTKTMWLSEDNLLEISFEGDKKLESRILSFFKAEKVKIIKADGRIHGVYNVKETRKIGKKFNSLDSFISVVADMIGFEINERSQCSDSATLVNEEGFKLSATLAEA